MDYLVYRGKVADSALAAPDEAKAAADFEVLKKTQPFIGTVGVYVHNHCGFDMVL